MTIEGLHVEHHGAPDGASVVLVHGAPDRSSAFRSVLGLLDEHHLVTYDRRGWGRSVAAGPPTGIGQHAEDLLALAAGLPDPVVVVAHSYGAHVTMLAATTNPSAFAAIGVWEPPLQYEEWWRSVLERNGVNRFGGTDPAAEIELAHRVILGDEVWESWPREVRDARRAEGPAYQVDMASLLAAPYAYEDVKVPAVVGGGAQSSSSSRKVAPWLLERLPDAQPFVVDGVGHFANRTHPEAFAAFACASIARALD
jgi:pimeloyl-ACP methyl ester carboxylesterase